MMRPGDRLSADTNAQGTGAVLRYQSDGNLVLYDAAGPLWSSGTSGAAGRTELQFDGNLVIYDAADVPIWATDTHAPGAVLHIARSGLRLVAPDGALVWQVETGAVDPGPPPAGQVRPLRGLVRIQGRSFADEYGPRLVHGCSDFAALPKMHEDPDRMLRQLDVVAQSQQYVRVLWRLNGWKWTTSGLTVDPIRDGWFDDVLRRYLEACRDRGIRVNLSSGDMYNWTDTQAEDSFRRVAAIAASVSPEVVWLSAVTNEMRGTMPGGESPENVSKMAHLLTVWTARYPWSLLAGSDPASQDKAGMRRLAPSPAAVALIHDVRQTPADALRRAFNTRYENDPGMPVVQDEPTGENGDQPAPWGQNVYQPMPDSDDLLALYTMHVLTGQGSTYFSDPSLVSREPLETTWGFTHLLPLWREMGVPEDIGQGTLAPGHHGDAPLQVVGSHAERADSAVIGAYSLGVISGGSGWQVRAGRDGMATAFTAAGVVWEGRVSRGQTLPIPGPTPTIVRMLS